jgi:DNA-binding NarL/FixJ family response regulator
VPDHEPRRILVVEDHAEFLRLISGTLRRRADFHIFEATDGREAVRKIEELQPDLVLLDINLPGLHGFQVAEGIRELAPRTTFLFMSQESSADIVRQALSLGASGFIHKQSIATDLLPAVDAVLAGQRFMSRSVASAESDKSPTPPTPAAPHRHEIRFCPDDAAIIEGMTRFIGAALGAGDPALLLVAKSHRPRVLQELRATGVDIDGAIEQGTFLSFDADEALDSQRFREALNSMREAAGNAGHAHSRMAFCGERAGRLWAAGRTAEAVQLEQFCCDLANEVDILCIYPVPHAQDDSGLALICSAHTAVFPE